jgi:hypothetical protein
MFIFITDQELCACVLVGHIIDCDHSLGRKYIIKFVYYFIILFLMIYIFKYFLLLVLYNHHENLHKYKIF